MFTRCHWTDRDLRGYRGGHACGRDCRLRRPADHRPMRASFCRRRMPRWVRRATPAAASSPTEAAAERLRRRPRQRLRRRRCRAGGWGTFKGQVVFEGSPPAYPVLQDKGKAAKDPEVCAVDGPIVSEQLIVDAATKGVKNVLVYFPRPSAVNEDAKKALTGKMVMFDQKKCIFEPHVLG